MKEANGGSFVGCREIINHRTGKKELFVFKNNKKYLVEGLIPTL